jgi:hypothetical protein
VRVADERGQSKWLVVLYALAAVATILTFLFQFHVLSWPPFDGDGSKDRLCVDASISLSRGSGPSGTQIAVRGKGFPSEERVTLRFATEEMLPSRTDADGAFEGKVVIPGTFDAFAPMQVMLVAETSTPVCFASAPFQLTL